MKLKTSNGSVRLGVSTGVWPYGFPDANWFKNFFRRAEEEWGFEDIVTVDRPAWPHPVNDSVILMAMGAALTKRAQLVGMLVLPYRVPFILAKEIATIDYLSGGRTALALGVAGDYLKEFDASGVPAKQRPSRLEEGMNVMRELWTGEPVNMDGKYQKLDDIQQLPRPVNGTVPLWLAHRARSEASIDRSARMSDGWLSSWVSPRRLTRATAEIREKAQKEYGRDPNAIAITQLVRIYVAKDIDTAAHQVATFRAQTWGHPYEPDLVKHLQVVGTPEDCRAKLKAFAEAGAECIYLQVEAPMAEWENQMAIIQREVIGAGDLV